MDKLLSELMEWLNWNKAPRIGDVIIERLLRYDDRITEAKAPTPWRPSILRSLMEFRLALRKRYYDEVLERTLAPFALSLTSDGNRHDVIMSANQKMYLVSEWCEHNSPSDRSAVQFFETVGMLMESSEHDQGQILLDGEIKRAMTRGSEGYITLDNGGLKYFADIGTLIRWLA